ncbi:MULTISPECIES: hypothetical protein [unclassified Dysgonomonas]|uniref:hypothetical protein n=1 Tax=unclassified Dysgonomonas TaxID=2630389 RepID=UPI0025BDDC7D|nr:MULTISPECIES: hypothetical protein [unclassified Dysgonomonas]
MKGICFIEPLHDKTVKKTKTETRRIIVNQPLENEIIKPFANGFFGIYHKVGGIDNLKVTLKPRYNVGEILYLKEPYFILESKQIEYRYEPTFFLEGCVMPKWQWKNKLFMPASAARHFIKITAVRAERLQDISNEDCIKEGIWFGETSSFYYNGLFHSKGNYKGKIKKYLTAKEAYKALINSIDGKDTWDNNPWVWVYDYKLIDRKEVQI